MNEPSHVNSLLLEQEEAAITQGGDELTGPETRGDEVVAERTLRIERERLRLALSAGQMGVYDLSIKHDVLWWSPEVYVVFGVSPETFTPTREAFAELVHPEDREKYWQHLEECTEQGQHFTHEFRIRRPDGQERWISSRAETEYDDAGAAVRHFGVATDITERKKAELHTLQNAELFSSLIEQAPIGTYVVDAQLRLRQINPVARPAFSGIEPLIGRSLEGVVEILWGGEVGAGILARFRHTLETGERYISPRFAQVRNDRGNEEAYEWEIQRVVLPEGGYGVVCYFNDVTPRYRAERALVESEERVRLATAATGVGIWEWNVITNTVWWDEPMFHIYGIPPRPDGMVQYEDWSHAVLTEDLAENLKILEETVSKGGSSVRSFRIRRRSDGAVRHVECVETTRVNAQGQVEWVVGTDLDVTERRLAAEALVANAKQLTEADRRKDEFLAMLAHELRNPLAPMRNMTEVLKTATLNEEEKQNSLAILTRQLGNMSRMIDDLLDAARITQGKIELRKKVVALEEMVKAAVSLAQADGMKRGQEVLLQLPDEAVYLDADPTRIEQVLGNLLNNARKYSDDGSPIKVRVERDGSEVVISVSDRGVGIDAQLLPRIFELFVQESRTLERERGGLGIGLTLAERLVRLHGGSIEAKSAGAGQGAEFSVRLPMLMDEKSAAIEKRTGAPAARVVRERPRRILIVDDNEDSACSLALLHERRGHETRIAFTGPDAVAAAAEFLPEVVILDVGLPGMNGFEVARRIRALPGLADAFLVAMSGYGNEEDLAEGKRAGFNEYLVKPVDLKKLREWIR
jgi:PAS domain S-box-containing protein